MFEQHTDSHILELMNKENLQKKTKIKVSCLLNKQHKKCNQWEVILVCLQANIYGFIKSETFFFSCRFFMSVSHSRKEEQLYGLLTLCLSWK